MGVTMPLRRWKHLCGCGGKGALYVVPNCERCGVPGEYVGWDWSMHEAMGRYQSWYGFKPIGPHRKLVDELFGPRVVRCSTCGGSGLKDIDSGQAYGVCDSCAGDGRLFDGSESEFERLRQEVLARYPDSGAPRVRAGAKPLAFDVAANTIVDLDEV